MEILDCCPICGHKESMHFLMCIDYTVSKKNFDIVSCKSCGFYFTNPRPEAKDIGRYYQSEDYISHSNSKKGLFNKLYQMVRNYTIAQKLSLINKHVSRGTILDIGCGTGEFLNYCKQKNWETFGIEPGLEARNFAEKNYKLTVGTEEQIKEIADNSKDVITMWHVLEHVHQLNDRVMELKRIIKPNGVVIIAVPNCSSYDAIYYKEHWAAYDLPRHLYHFTPKNIIELFQKHGFKNIEIHPMKFDSFYVSMLSEKYKNGKINYLSSILMGLKSNLSAATKKNHSYSSQIYVFKK